VGAPGLEGVVAGGERVLTRKPHLLQEVEVTLGRGCVEADGRLGNLEALHAGLHHLLAPRLLGSLDPLDVLSRLAHVDLLR
jgi:hypothetical protein